MNQEELSCEVHNFALDRAETVDDHKRKYVLTEYTKEVDGHILHRIQALRDFSYIKAGKFGGWIEKEENLSHEGKCWVQRDAQVYGDAKVYEDAEIMFNASVFGNAHVRELAKISGSAKVYGNAYIYGNPYIGDHAEIFEQARIADLAMVTDSAKIHGLALLIGVSRALGSVDISGTTLISGAANLYDGVITSPDQYLVVGPIGSRNDFTTFFLKGDEILVKCGCFKGTIGEFTKRVITHHGVSRHANDYFDAIRMVKKYFKRVRQNETK